MTGNLKLAYSEPNLDSIAHGLFQDTIHVKINALLSVDSDSIDELLELVKLCAYDYRPSVRAQAYRTLKLANPEKITLVIKDAVRDIDQSAFKAARELLHNCKQ